MYYLFAIMCLLALGHSVYVVKEQCPANEEYLLCGSACPANCSSPAAVNCNEDCVEGCFCMTGFLRDSNGTCVSMDQCPGVKQVCGENEELVSCGTVCPATCAVPEPEVCGVACGMGCFCRDGFYRDEVNNKCVTMDNCSAEECFNANEVYDICNAACEPSCTDPEPICTKLCTGGCVCATGLLRGPDGTCVSVDKCPGNATDTNVLKKYLNAINDILHLTTA